MPSTRAKKYKYPRKENGQVTCPICGDDMSPQSLGGHKGKRYCLSVAETRFLSSLRLKPLPGDFVTAIEDAGMPVLRSDKCFHNSFWAPWWVVDLVRRIDDYCTYKLKRLEKHIKLKEAERWKYASVIWMIPSGTARRVMKYIWGKSEEDRELLIVELEILGPDKVRAQIISSFKEVFQEKLAEMYHDIEDEEATGV